LFSVVGDFSKKLLGIKDTAVKDLKKTVDDSDDSKKKKTTQKRPEEIAREKELQAQNDENLKKKQAANLEKMRKQRVDLENKKKMEVFKKADAESMKAYDKLPKKVNLDSKKLAKSIATATARFSTKMLPFIGAGFGIFEVMRRGVTGDLSGAALELGGVFAPSVAGAPIDASLVAKDVYKDMFGSDYAIDVVKNPSLANSRMGQIAAKVNQSIVELIKGKETANDGGGVQNLDAFGGSGPPIVINNVDNSKSSVDNSSQSVQSTPIQDLGLHPEHLMR